MRKRLLLLIVSALLASAGGAVAQVTPVASQLLPCRSGAGPFNTCGGLCAVGFACVYVPANLACSCQVDGLVCGVGTLGEQGFCPGLPNTPDGDCATAGGAGATGGAAATGGTNFRCR